MYGLSALIAPFVATFFRHIGLTWRQGFFLLALLPLIVGGISRFVGTRSRRGPDLAPHMQWSEWRHCMLFAAMMAGYLWGEISVSTRLVLWLRSDLGWSADTADLFLAGFFLTLLAGRVVLSFVNFKQVSNWMILWMSAGASTLLYFFGAALFARMDFASRSHHVGVFSHSYGSSVGAVSGQECAGPRLRTRIWFAQHRP